MFFNNYLLVTTLIFMRMGAMFTLIPVFSSKNVPIIAKIGFIVSISLILTPVILPNFDLPVDSFLVFAGYIVTEMLIGFALGFITTIITNSFYLAGSLLDRNIGFAMVSVIGAQDESQLPVSANLFYIFAMMIFLIGDIHHLLIRALVDSYIKFEIGSNPMFNLILYDFADVLAYSFVTGFKIAAPFILTVTIANVLLGLLSKAMPGMNVFMIGMPLKILIGLSLLLILVPLLSGAFINIFEEMIKAIYRLIG